MMIKNTNSVLNFNKSLSLLFLLFLIIYGCSVSYKDRIGVKRKSLKVYSNIDSSKILVTVKPRNYKWNTDTTLIDVVRKNDKYPPIPRNPNPSINIPYPFSPRTYDGFNILTSNYIKFYLCNFDESSCYKFQEGYFEKGIYYFGFQKFNADTGVYVVKMETPDTVISQYFVIP